MKKFLSGLALCFALSPVMVGESSAVSLFSASEWAQPYVYAGISSNLVPDSLQNNYNSAISRAEFCALAVASYEKVLGSEIAARATFTDTNDVNVEKMAGLGVVTGVTGSEFHPDSSITREQAAIILSNLSEKLGMNLESDSLNFGDNWDVSSWAVDAVGKVNKAGIMGETGDNFFSPKATYTKEQSILTLLKVYCMSTGEDMTGLVNKAQEYLAETPVVDEAEKAIFVQYFHDYLSWIAEVSKLTALSDVISGNEGWIHYFRLSAQLCYSFDALVPPAELKKEHDATASAAIAKGDLEEECAVFFTKVLNGELTSDTYWEEWDAIMKKLELLDSSVLYTLAEKMEIVSEYYDVEDAILEEILLEYGFSSDESVEYFTVQASGEGVNFPVPSMNDQLYYSPYLSIEERLPQYVSTLNTNLYYIGREFLRLSQPMAFSNHVSYSAFYIADENNHGFSAIMPTLTFSTLPSPFSTDIPPNFGLIYYLENQDGTTAKIEFRTALHIAGPNEFEYGGIQAWYWLDQENEGDYYYSWSGGGGPDYITCYRNGVEMRTYSIF